MSCLFHPRYPEVYNFQGHPIQQLSNSPTSPTQATSKQQNASDELCNPANQELTMKILIFSNDAYAVVCRAESHFHPNSEVYLGSIDIRYLTQ